MTDKGIIEAFRNERQGAIEAFRSGASSLVIPEIFYRESKFFLLLWFLNTMDPGLKIAGVTNKGNRAIQG